MICILVHMLGAGMDGMAVCQEPGTPVVSGGPRHDVPTDVALQDKSATSLDSTSAEVTAPHTIVAETAATPQQQQAVQSVEATPATEEQTAKHPVLPELPPPSGTKSTRSSRVHEVLRREKQRKLELQKQEHPPKDVEEKDHEKEEEPPKDSSLTEKVEKKDKKKTPKQQDMTGMFPEPPTDWKKVDYVSSEMQQPPAKRGRKPKKEKDESKVKPEAKGKARGGRKAKAKATPKGKTKEEAASKRKGKAKAAPKSSAKEQTTTRRKRRASKTLAPAAGSATAAREALEALPVKRGDKAPVDPALKKQALSKKQTIQYEPMEIPEDANRFDAFAQASAACALQQLGEQHSGQDKSNSNSKKRKPVSEEDLKAKRSRKCCAYKKARNEYLKAGHTQEEAVAAAKKVTNHIPSKL